MHKYSKIAIKIAMLVLTLFMLTGCVSADYRVRVDPSGSVLLTYKLLFQKTILQLSMLGAEGMDADTNPVDIYENSAQEQGYETTRIIEGDGTPENELEGFVATKRLKSIEDMEFLTFDTGGDICRMTHETYIVKKGLLRNHYSLKLDLERIPEAIEDEEYTGEDDGFTYAIQSGLDLKLTIDLPFKPVSSNSTVIENNGKRHIWIPEYYFTTAVELEGYVLNYPVVIPLAVVILAALLLLLMKILRIKKKKNEPGIKEDEESLQEDSPES